MKKKLTIKKIGDEKKCLTFRWVLVPMGGKKSGKIIDDNDYTCLLYTSPSPRDS